MAKRRPPVFLFIDTCVWLDLADDYTNQPLLSALEGMVKQHHVSLVTPKFVLDEFRRNKDRIVETSGRAVVATVRRAKDMLAKYGDKEIRDAAMQLLHDLDHKSVNYKDAATDSVNRIEALFAESVIVDANSEVKLRAAERALKSKAPFHRQRNSMNDAVLIELFGKLQRGRGGQFVFVSHNTKDFSQLSGDDRLPHPDIAKFFSSKSHYYTKLGDALNRFRPDEYQEIMIEQEWYFPPRKFSEMSDAISKLIDQVWYNRHQVWNERLQSGEAKLIENHEERGKDPLGKRIHRNVWERAERSARALEAKYPGELGPWDDFEWGMVNGKLSALRWVFGEDWDELYT